MAGADELRELARPALQAMLLCDQAVIEEGSYKVTLVGIFDRIGGESFPLHWTRPALIYVRITDAEGDYLMQLELVRLDDEQTIGRQEARVAIEDRLVSSSLVFNLETLVYERPGRYEFRLFANGRHVGGMTLSVIQTGY